jgi:hypothetical protein
MSLKQRKKLCSWLVSFLNEIETEEKIVLGLVSFLNEFEIKNETMLRVGFIFK